MNSRRSQPCWRLALCCCCCAFVALHALESDEWVIRMKGGPKLASLLALRSGYLHIGSVLGFKDTYLWHAIDGLRYKKRGMRYAMSALKSHIKIVWADRQRAVRRQKRGYHTDPVFNDELWNQEWYLQEHAAQTTEKLPRASLDLNVLPAYRLGVTGRGIRIAVLDDGLEYTHEDLRANYDPEISYDVTDRDDDPIPRYEEPVVASNRSIYQFSGRIALDNQHSLNE